MSAASVQLPISQIRLDGGTQPRTALDFDAVEDYAEAMGAGAKFPPVAVYYDGENHWLADGFHRLKAAFAAGFDTIACELRQGTLEDARWHSFSANKTNGLRRTNEDKQRAVKAALLHPHAAGMSNNAIARHVGVDEATVRNWRARLSASSEIPKMATRTVTRLGKTYEQRATHQTEKRASRRRAKDPLDAFLRAVETIANCGIAARDLASLAASRDDRDQIIALMEQTREFLELCTAEARSAALAAGDSGITKDTDASDAGGVQAVA